MSLFIHSKYTHWYYSLIEKRKVFIPEEYTEKHHIIPKCLGGKDTPDNLVALTAREHIVAHWLLTKMVDSEAHKKKMYYAFAAMLRIGKGHERKLTILEAAKCREYKSKARKGSCGFPNEESRQRWEEAMKEVNARPEVKAKRSNSAKKAQRRPEVRAKYKKTYSTPEYKEKQSKACKEAQNRLEVKMKKSEKTKSAWQKPGAREKGRLAAIECQNRPEVKAKKSKVIKEAIRTCSHCNKTGVGPAMFRFHFSRCRTLNNSAPTD